MPNPPLLDLLKSNTLAGWIPPWLICCIYAMSLSRGVELFLKVRGVCTAVNFIAKWCRWNWLNWYSYTRIFYQSIALPRRQLTWFLTFGKLPKSFVLLGRLLPRRWYLFLHQNRKSHIWVVVSHHYHHLFLHPTNMNLRHYHPTC